MLSPNNVLATLYDMFAKQDFTILQNLLQKRFHLCILVIVICFTIHPICSKSANQESNLFPPDSLLVTATSILLCFFLFISAIVQDWLYKEAININLTSFDPLIILFVTLSLLHSVFRIFNGLAKTLAKDRN